MDARASARIPLKNNMQTATLPRSSRSVCVGAAIIFSTSVRVQNWRIGRRASCRTARGGWSSSIHEAEMDL